MPNSKKQRSIQSPKRVAVVIYEGLCTFEYGIAVEVFGLYRSELGGHLYHVTSVSLEGQSLAAAGGLSVTATGTFADLDEADIIVIPGWRGNDQPVPPILCEAVKKSG